ncbi:MAG: PAS domain S-box protein [Planctomycetes bacterium]|nr:PAS domain S-box protein [Planctomycetota bacterium]
MFRVLLDRSSDAIEVLDPKTGRFIDVNERACLDLGYSREEFLALHAYDIDPMVSQTTFAKGAEELRKSGSMMWNGIHRRRDGSTFPVEANIKYVRLDRDYIVAVVRDITERKAAEEKIQASLKEKETLLREIHHRVKNNLQVISSLIGLQSHDIRDATAIEALKKLQNRIKSMAIIHEKLYMSDNLSRIDFADYVATISSNLFHIFGVDQREIKLFIHIDNLDLDLDSAMPCGLIINELLSNALKHAFPASRPGEIRVAMNREKDGSLVLSISDNGRGIPADINTSKTTTLGLRLINILTYQLGGQLEIKRENGTEFILRFREG